jgi:outer membrane lipoprotein carrier protein
MATLFCNVLLCLFSLPARNEASNLAARMEGRYRNATTLQATFLERYSENGAVLRTESGTARFRRPGKMRWEYDRPEKDLFLVDGKTAWFYVPADHTVTRVPAKQSEDLRTPLALLAGQMKISRICSRVEIAEHENPLNEGDAVLHCVVRGQRKNPMDLTSAQADSAFGNDGADAIFFEVNRDTGELARIIVRQAGGIQVEFRFENWRFDPPIPESMFHFEAPPGVAIVNGELPDGKNQGN